MVFTLATLGFIVFASYRIAYRGGLPWVDIAAYVHSDRRAIDCGHVVEPDYPAAEAAIKCANEVVSAKKPFRVVFTMQNIEGPISDAVVGNSNGNGVEIFYVYAMRVTKHNCGAPLRFEVDDSYRNPILHCFPWPPTDLKRDYLFW